MSSDTLENSADQSASDSESSHRDEKAVSRNVKLTIARMFREKPYMLVKSKHNSLPDMNCSKQTRVLDTVRKSEWTVSLPTPIFSPASDNIDLDPCHKRTRQQRNYINSIQFLPIHYRISQRNKLIRKAKSRGIYPYNVVRYTELLEQNPDEYFDGTYDWYYTGGNLEAFQKENENYVLHASGNNLEDLNVSKVDQSDDRLKLSHLLRKRAQAIIIGNDHPEILEIQNVNNSHVLVRRRNYISLYAFDDNNNYLNYRYHMYNGEVPFISAARASSHGSDLITSDLNRIVVLWDLNRSAEKPKQHLFTSKHEEKSKNWNCVRYLDEHLAVLANLQKFHLIDSRQSAEENNRCSYSLHAPHEMCELNSIVAPSNFSDLIYIGSSHKLVAIDRRFIGSECETTDKYTVLKWTHQLESAPLMLRTARRCDNLEIILIASAINGDIRLCENNKIEISKSDTDSSLYYSAQLPLKPPSLSDAYRQARLEGVCIDPYAGILQRLNYSHTGAVLLNDADSENFESVLLGNSNGDISSQMLVSFCDEDIVNDDNLAAMKQWQDFLRSQDAKNRPALNVTSVESLAPLKKIFQCDRLEASVDAVADEIEKNCKVRRGRWQRSIKSLRQYKDALAADMLSVWDVEDDAEMNIRKAALPQERQANETAETLINQWLDRTAVIEFDESLLEAIGVPAESDSIMNTTVNSEQNTTAIVEGTQATNSSAKVVRKPVKRKYIKGF